ncbi:MAG: SMC family ATPase, partial [Candidatus Aenigmarchaeota archaeon]|nr:SMC family ATPase [Candidatus Aenigmarchaeota archaeon]
MIKEIELENFRSHRKTKLNFTEGNNILIGISGSGKSSVLDAICFALYGNIPKIQKRKIKLSDLIMDKPVKEEIARIKLVFEANTKNYEIKREIFLDKPSNAELREEGRLIAVNQSQVTEAVAQILKMDYDLFSKVIYAEQNQIDYFLTLPPGDRMNNIDELLKLSKFESARARTISISNRFKNLKNAKEEAVANFDEVGLKEKWKSLGESSVKLEKEEVLLENKIREIKSLLGDKEKIVFELEKKKKESDDKRRRIIEVKTIISVFQNEIEETPHKDINEIEKNLSVKENEFKLSEAKELEREKNISIASSRISEMEKKLGEKKECESFLSGFDKNKFERLVNELEEIKEKLLDRKIKCAGLEKAVNSLKESKEKCPTCDSALDEEKRKKLIKQKEGELISLNEELSNLNREFINKRERKNAENKNTERAG